MRPTLLSLLGLLALASCARSGTDVRETDGAYTVMARAPDTVNALLISQHALLEQAREYCEIGGKRFDVAGDDTSIEDGVVSYRLRFRCLGGDDPRVARPATNGVPDATY